MGRRKKPLIEKNFNESTTSNEEVGVNKKKFEIQIDTQLDFNSSMEDEAIDSATEDYNTDNLKLQDIAAIVLGDVKQVCINTITSDSENESFSSLTLLDDSKNDSPQDVRVSRDITADSDTEVRFLRIPADKIVNGICRKRFPVDIADQCEDFEKYDSKSTKSQDIRIDENYEINYKNNVDDGNLLENISRIPSLSNGSPIEHHSVLNSFEYQPSSNSVNYDDAETSSIRSKHELEPNIVNSSISPNDIKYDSDHSSTENEFHSSCDSKTVDKLVEYDESDEENLDECSQSKPYISEFASLNETDINNDDSLRRQAERESFDICERLKDDLRNMKFSDRDSNSYLNTTCVIDMDIPLPPSPPLNDHKYPDENSTSNPPPIQQNNQDEICEKSQSYEEPKQNIDCEYKELDKYTESSECKELEKPTESEYKKFDKHPESSKQKVENSSKHSRSNKNSHRSPDDRKKSSRSKHERLSGRNSRNDDRSSDDYKRDDRKKYRSHRAHSRDRSSRYRDRSSDYRKHDRKKRSGSRRERSSDSSRYEDRSPHRKSKEYKRYSRSGRSRDRSSKYRSDYKQSHRRRDKSYDRSKYDRSPDHYRRKDYRKRSESSHRYEHSREKSYRNEDRYDDYRHDHKHEYRSEHSRDRSKTNLFDVEDETKFDASSIPRDNRSCDRSPRHHTPPIECDPLNDSFASQNDSINYRDRLDSFRDDGIFDETYERSLDRDHSPEHFGDGKFDETCMNEVIADRSTSRFRDDGEKFDESYTRSCDRSPSLRHDHKRHDEYSERCDERGYIIDDRSFDYGRDKKRYNDHRAPRRRNRYDRSRYKSNERYSSDRRSKYRYDTKKRNQRSCSSEASSDGSHSKDKHRFDPKLEDKVGEMLKSLADENWDEERPPEPPEPEYCGVRPPEPKSPPPELRFSPVPCQPPEPDYPPPDECPSPVDDGYDTAPTFEPILENEYRTERSVSKDAERMICDCILTKEEIIRGEKGCGDDCLNRLLLIECCSRCGLADRCTNKRFQRREYPKCEIYKTKKKGHGLRILEDIPSGTFIMEYVGEVLNAYEFERRAMEYARGKYPHFYFMSLKSDCIIDATIKGNISRFINHSCEPNAETQKWTVQGELRIGFFSKRDIKAGEEVTFDYQLQRYGKQAQRCYCETSSCSGWIGGDPDKMVENKRRKNKQDEYLDWEATLEEISQVGLMNRHQTLSLNRLMVHAKELPVRMQILQLIEEGNPPCRRLFLDYHGLPIIWSWMVDCTPEQDELKIQLLKTLAALPITNKTILVDSKVLSVVEQWAFVVDQKIQSSEALSAQSVLESVEDIASAEETPVSELAQKVLNDWSSLREAYKIPRKERIQQMKKHEQEADQNMMKPRTKRLPMYAEQMRNQYHRNRHNRDKDFDKIYVDRMNDYDSDNRKRRDSPERRNFEQRKRQGRPESKDGNDYLSSINNKFSKLEHRYNFERKVARENERKREEEEQQQQWLKMYYSQQQPSISGIMLPAQYLTSVPPPNYPADTKASSITRTHPYYAVPPPSVYPAMMPAHMQPPTQIPTQATQTPSTPLPAQATPSQYYRPITYPPPGAVTYPHLALPEQVANTESYSFANTAIPNQLQQIAKTDDIPVPIDQRIVEELKPEPVEAPETATIGDGVELKLPPKWKTARDANGKMYFYHTKTRVSQWYPPACNGESDDDSSSTGDENDVEFKKKRRKKDEKVEFDMDAEIKENLAAMSSEFQDSDYEDYSPILKAEEAEESETEKTETVPLVTEHIISPREPVDPEERKKDRKRIRQLKEKLKRHKKHKIMNGGNQNGGSSNGHCSNGNKLVSAPADTSSITERKKKDAFRSNMANFVVNCLNPYFRSSCTQAKITNYSDFKHLARKLTHFVMLKELKHCQSITDLTCNSSVKHKAKEYIRKYMSKFGEIYERPPDDNNY